MRRPILAVTPGDPAGIGPEVLMRYLAEAEALAQAPRLLIVGDAGVLRRESEAFGLGMPPAALTSPLDLPDEDVLLYECLPPLARLPERGRIDEVAGRVSHAWVLEAIRLAMAGIVDGVVTGPIHKEAWREAGVAQPGHTEVLRDTAGVPRVLMMLAGGRLRVALATIHVALREVPTLIGTQDLVDTLLLLAAEIERWMGPRRPRIAVCGLNPHAGEGGLFGREENDIIEPAVEIARGRGVDALGPLPADACIPAAAAGAYDAVLAMFHDQALPAVKTLAPRRAVNITLGLPFVRTSVDHGTAFDIAGQGRAGATSLAEAVRVAAEMVERNGARAQ